MRALGAVSGNTGNGVFTNRVGQLTPDFFTNLLDMMDVGKIGIFGSRINYI